MTSTLVHSCHCGGGQVEGGSRAAHRPHTAPPPDPATGHVQPAAPGFPGTPCCPYNTTCCWGRPGVGKKPGLWLWAGSAVPGEHRWDGHQVAVGLRPQLRAPQTVVPSLPAAGPGCGAQGWRCPSSPEPCTACSRGLLSSHGSPWSTDTARPRGGSEGGVEAAKVRTAPLDRLPQRPGQETELPRQQAAQAPGPGLPFPAVGHSC